MFLFFTLCIFFSKFYNPVFGPSVEHFLQYSQVFLHYRLQLWRTRSVWAQRCSLSFSLKATHDLIKYEVEVMDDFILERQHPLEIQARPGLQMASW